MASAANPATRNGVPSPRPGGVQSVQGHEASCTVSKVRTIMSSRTRMNRVLIGLGIVALAAATAGTESWAEAVVDQTRKIELPRQAESSAAEMRDAYRRPPSIPFPKNNPYTAEKMLL